MSSSAFSAAKKRAQGVVVTDREVVATLSAPSLTVTQNGSATVTVFASRTNYSGVVTPSASGLPSGVTAAFVPAVLGKGQTSTVMTLSATGSASVVTADAFTVTLTHALGTSTVDATVTVEATVDPGAPYSVTSVVPSSGSPNATRAVTITGTGFQSGATVAVGGTAATSVVVVNATTITATLPAKALGTYDLTVTQTEGVATLTNGVSYGAVPFFEDNLEGGQFNNANGVTWSIGDTFWTVSSDRGVNGGTHSFKGTYTARTASQAGEQATADLKFNLGRDCNAFAAEWWVYVPSNYFHRDRVAGSDNNKWFGIFRDTINNNDAWRAVLEANLDTGNAGGSLSRPVAAQSNLGTIIAQTQNPGAGVPMLNNPGAVMTAGAWNRIRWYSRFSSADGVNDGILKIWMNDTLLEGGKTDGDYWQENRTRYPTPAVNLGYFMGACNSGFNENTTFYVADVKFYDQDPGW